MKLQYLRLAFCDEANILSPSPSPSPSSSSSLTINCKRLRPIAPKFASRDDTDILTSLDLRSFNSPKPTKCTDQAQNPDASPPSSTRWNPTQEQIRTLEELYKGGMRTPNAQQIERITEELSKYGRIEGKNVFYWFQNHKARERQRQKRSAALLALDTAPESILALFSDPKVGKEEAKWCDGGNSKRKRRWESDEGDGTLELFPLHPERD